MALFCDNRNVNEIILYVFISFTFFILELRLILVFFIKIHSKFKLRECYT